MTTMPEIDGYLSDNELAELLGVSKATLARMRRKGEGPPWMRVGASKNTSIRYPKLDLAEWLEARTVRGPQ